MSEGKYPFEGTPDVKKDFEAAALENTEADEKINPDENIDTLQEDYILPPPEIVPSGYTQNHLPVLVAINHAHEERNTQQTADKNSEHDHSNFRDNNALSSIDLKNEFDRATDATYSPDEGAEI